MNYEPVIGLEIHVELKTKSGMFCGCPADHFGKPPNTNTCPVCLGLPGALPVANKQAIEWTIMLGLALGAEISEYSKFDRKHYFYPDLPKGYQISQYDQPLCRGGSIDTSGGTVRIHRVHLEEDTGKLQHATVDGKKVTLVDFNRSGVPLVEIVTEPDITSAEQAKEFLKKLHRTVRYLGISDADMEKGSMRLEPNISLRPKGTKSLPDYKVEVKNINSFRFVARAIEYETKRHAAILDSGKTPAQETRGWNEAKGATVSQRTKEEAADYRYFPDPDLPPMRFTKADIARIRDAMPVLPDARKTQVMEAYGLTEQQTDVLVDDIARLALFENVVAALAKNTSKTDPVTTAKWVINRVQDAKGVTAKDVAAQIQEHHTVVAVDSTELDAVIFEVLAANEKAVEDYKKGKEQALMFLMGQVKRKFPNADASGILESLKLTLSK